jgi:3-carboxy-cis,cis-muconate cycloisomerase
MSDGPSLFGGTFARGPVAELVSSTAWLQALLDVEGALARAAASAGAIPAEMAAAISSACAEGASYNAVEIATAAADSGSPVVPLVSMIRTRVGNDAAASVHFGATSQDIVDSAMMLIARRAALALAADLATAADAASALAVAHADSPIVGRSLLQAARPTTFGLKAASWMSALDGARGRLQQVADGCPVQYGGPVGTLASAGPYGAAIRAALAGELGLRETAIAWHTDRTPVLDLAGAVGIVAGAVATTAVDIILLSQSEVAEVSEGGVGRGGSSSMPHKRNSIAAISARACAIRAPGLVATVFRCAEQEHERAAGAWHAEWETLSDLLRLAGSGVAWLADSLTHLTVHADVMSGRAATALAESGPGDDLGRHVAAAAAQVDAALAHRPGGAA